VELETLSDQQSLSLAVCCSPSVIIIGMPLVIMDIIELLLVGMLSE